VTSTVRPPSAGAFRTSKRLDHGQLREAFGTFPTGVVAVAAQVDGRPVGLTASSFTSVSLDPPLVSFSVANTSKTWPTLRQASRLGVTVLADHHGVVARQLAGPVEERFTGLELQVTGDGAVTLADGLTSFHTTIHEELPAGDHTIVLLRLLHITRAASTAPLVFHGSTFRRLMVD